jgi:hypothetical protein
MIQKGFRANRLVIEHGTRRMLYQDAMDAVLGDAGVVDVNLTGQVSARLKERRSGSRGLWKTRKEYRNDLSVKSSQVPQRR